jgi:hypothetical protein
VQWVLPTICLLTAGCSIPTLPAINSATETQIGGQILLVPVPKTGFTDCTSAYECTLVRAAEATQRVGGTHFIVLPGHGGSTQASFAYIKVFTLDAGDTAPSSAISVEEALHFFRKLPHEVAS